jgi:3-hydroxyisobutyrate dehydrogenase-like beta-hydroxyacid dehydrogenase
MLGVVGVLTCFFRQPSLIVWNRGSDGIDLFKALADKEQISYKVAGSLEEIGQQADIILASLGSDHASEEVFQVLFAAQEKKVDRGKSTIFVDMSTVRPLPFSPSPR